MSKKVVKKEVVKKDLEDLEDLKDPLSNYLHVVAKGTSKETELDLKKEINEVKAELAEIKSVVKTFKKELKGLVEIQQRLVHERLNVPVPPPPKEYGEEPSTSKAKINITSIDSERIRVAGNTFDFKTAIKEAGSAKWEQATKSWSLPSECLDKLIKNLEELNLVRDTDFSVSVENTKKRTGSEDGGFGSGFAD